MSDTVTTADIDTINVLGVEICAIDMEVALRTVSSWIDERLPNFVCFRDVHGVMAAQGDAALRRIHRAAGLVCPDGMPLVWLGRLSGRRGMGRVCGPDMMLEMCRESVARGYRHFLYGGAPGVAERLAERLCARVPGLHIAGCHCPPYRSLTAEEDAEIVRTINASKADIVWVGLGTPKQEHWMADHVGRLDAPVLLGVGAAFDFLSGTRPRAPAWMQRYGLEWLFRLMTEPRRLWRRYLVLAPLFALRAAQQGLGLKRYPANV